jgi:hypothetical protein
LGVISRREASIFACVADVYVDPGPSLPAVAATDAAFAFDRALAAGPSLNRVALRAAMLVLELAPLAMGYGHRLRRLPRAQRTKALMTLDRTGPLAPLMKAIRATAQLSYYGDEGVLRRLGYDASGVVARGAAIRAKEGRW